MCGHAASIISVNQGQNCSSEFTFRIPLMPVIPDIVIQIAKINAMNPRKTLPALSLDSCMNMWKTDARQPMIPNVRTSQTIPKPRDSALKRLKHSKGQSRSYIRSKTSVKDTKENI